MRAAADIDPERMIATELSLKNGAVLLWAGTICAPVEAEVHAANRASFVVRVIHLIPLSSDKPLANNRMLS